MTPIDPIAPIASIAPITAIVTTETTRSGAYCVVGNIFDAIFSIKLYTFNANYCDNFRIFA